MIMIFVYTEFERFFKYPPWKYSAVIKTQMQAENNSLIENPQKEYTGGKESHISMM